MKKRITWTQEMDTVLRDLRMAGYSSFQIARQIHPSLTRSAVLGRAHRLGLPCKNPPGNTQTPHILKD